MSESRIAIEKSGLMVANVENLRYHQAENLRVGESVSWRNEWREAAKLHEKNADGAIKQLA